MTRYRLVYQDMTRRTHTLIREQPAESDVAAAMKMLLPHPETNKLRPTLSPPGEDEYAVLERYDEDAGAWTPVEALQRRRSGWAHE